MLVSGLVTNMGSKSAGGWFTNTIPALTSIAVLSSRVLKSHALAVRYAIQPVHTLICQPSWPVSFYQRNVGAVIYRILSLNFRKEVQE